MKDTCRTINSASEGLYREKGSRFLAFAYPVHHETEIGERIDALRKKHHNARHHCYAWRLGVDQNAYMFSDDGEPPGTAGRPIYGQIRSRELTDVLVVVVRYFGGTLLGTGGLAQAYKAAAADALDRAKPVQKRVSVVLRVEFGYAQMDRVMKAINRSQLEFLDQQFDRECRITLRVWRRRVPMLLESLSKIEGCRIVESG